MNTITVQDIQGKISDSADTKIRKAWVLQISDETRATIQSMPLESRRSMYKALDQDVLKHWIGKMRQHREDALANGVKMIRSNGFYRLPDEYCDQQDQMLIDAALEVIQLTVQQP